MIDLDQLTLPQLEEITRMAHAIYKNPGHYRDACHGKIMATLFYEPSTRTQMSFQAAMMRLGGNVIGFDNPAFSSVVKGENLKDTVRVVSNYADLIVLRHPKEGAAKAAMLYSKGPVINAGDGGHLHPTQTLTDLATLSETKGRLNRLTVGLCGDLRYGRTVHSLIKTLSRYGQNRFVLISTPELCVPEYIKDAMNRAGCPFEEVFDLGEAISRLDVLYMTRIQRERFPSNEEYERQKGVYLLTQDKLRLAKNDMRILHPLPRVDEIAPEIDDDPRAVYFEQTEYGMYARMALILFVLDAKNAVAAAAVGDNSPLRCANPNCVTGTEDYLPNLFEKGGRFDVCEYCEHQNDPA